MNLNQVNLCGRLGKDPEMRYTPGGTAVCNFSLALSSYTKKKDGDGYDETVTWVDVTCWGKMAERAAAQSKKGTEALISGRIDTRSWEDKDDSTKKHFRTFVTALHVQFGHNRVGVDEEPPEQKETSPDQDETPPAQNETPAESPSGNASDEEDDLPF